MDLDAIAFGAEVVPSYWSILVVVGGAIPCIVIVAGIVGIIHFPPVAFKRR